MYYIFLEKYKKLEIYLKKEEMCFLLYDFLCNLFRVKLGKKQEGQRVRLLGNVLL